MEYRRIDDKVIVRLDPGDEIVGKLEELRSREGLNGFFYGIGTVNYLKLGFYDLKTRRYIEKEFYEDLEVTCLLGNIGRDGVHSHITVTDRDYRALGGHLIEARVSGTLEMTIFTIKGELARQIDEETGLRRMAIIT